MARTLGSGTGRGHRGASVTGRTPRGVDKKAADTATMRGTEHDSNNRRTILRECIRDVLALRVQQKEIGEDISTIMKKRVKADLGMDMTDFNRAYKLFLMEGTDRDEALDAMREVFDAMGIGSPFDSEPTKPQNEMFEETEANAEHDADRADGEGYKAGKAGLNMDSHNYTLPHQERLKASYETGWARAQEEEAMALGGAEVDTSQQLASESTEA